MSERELDRAIDTAARDMMSHEPGRGLSSSVMSRVRGGGEPPLRFTLAAAVAGVVISTAIASVLMTRSTEVVSLPPERHPAIAEAAVLPAFPADVRTEGERSPARVAAAIVRAPASPASANGAPAIDAIQTEPIAVAALEVPQIERDSTSIETIDIEPITIEPLAASND